MSYEPTKNEICAAQFAYWTERDGKCLMDEAELLLDHDAWRMALIAAEEARGPKEESEIERTAKWLFARSFYPPLHRHEIDTWWAKNDAEVRDEWRKAARIAVRYVRVGKDD